MPRAAPHETRDRFLAVIAVFKFFKAALLVTVGLGALHMMKPGAAEAARDWAAALNSAMDRRIAQQALARLTGVTPGRMEALGIGAFLYAALFATEGTGLWMGRRWAEYLTVVATASLIPFELYEVVQRLTALRVAALLVNVAVVIYLIYRLRHPVRVPAR